MPADPPPPQRRLRLVLLANAGFSAVSAAVLLLGRERLAAEVAVAAAELVQIGLSLAGFAVLLIVVATRRRLPLGPVVGFAVADAAWVVATSGWVLWGGPAVSTVGRVLIVAVALVVGTFGYLQLLGVRQLSARRRATA